jgi:putative transposase
MKKQKQTKYSADFKAEVVKEMLREEKSYSQISSEYKVHTTQLNRWKTTVTEGMASLFEKNKKEEEEKQALEEKVQELYGEIGRLTTQMNWLKKKSGIAIQ